MNILVISALAKAASLLLDQVHHLVEAGDHKSAQDMYARACAVLQPIAPATQVESPKAEASAAAAAAPTRPSVPVAPRKQAAKSKHATPAPKKAAPRKASVPAPAPVSKPIPVPAPVPVDAQPELDLAAPGSAESDQEFGDFDPSAFADPDIPSLEDDEEPLDPPEGTTWNDQVRKGGAWVPLSEFPGIPNEFDAGSSSYLSTRTGQWEKLDPDYHPTCQIGSRNGQQSGGCSWETVNGRSCWVVRGDTLATLSSKGLPG